MDCLAILGATPKFSEMRHVGRPNIPDIDAVMSSMRNILERRWLTNDGPVVKAFESAVAAAAGTNYAVAVCNATIALEIVVRALGMAGEVIVPSFTFVATAHCLSWQGMRPVFCDVDPETLLLDVDSAERLITPRTTGIVGVHLWGRMDNALALEKLAARHRLKLVFDAAHSLGCAQHGRRSGQFGDAEVFSFHATKFINSFEGGAVVTNDAELAARMRSLRNFGFDGEDNSVEVGTNGKMPEVCAAMGLLSLASIDEIIAVNQRNFRAYRDKLADLPGLRLFAPTDDAVWNFQYLVLRVDASCFGLHRDELRAVLLAENVYARRYFNPGCHRMPAYRDENVALPVTETASNEVLVLPTGTAMSSDDVSVVCATIRSAFRLKAEVRNKIRAMAQ